MPIGIFTPDPEKIPTTGAAAISQVFGPYPRWFKLIGWEITLPAAYTGEFRFTKTVLDTAHETNIIYETNNGYTNITNDSIISEEDPILVGRKGDSILFETTAIPAEGFAYVTLFISIGNAPEGTP